MSCAPPLETWTLTVSPRDTASGVTSRFADKGSPAWIGRRGTRPAIWSKDSRPGWPNGANPAVSTRTSAGCMDRLASSIPAATNRWPATVTRTRAQTSRLRLPS